MNCILYWVTKKFYVTDSCIFVDKSFLAILKVLVVFFRIFWADNTELQAPYKNPWYQVQSHSPHKDVQVGLQNKRVYVT